MNTARPVSLRVPSRGNLVREELAKERDPVINLFPNGSSLLRARADMLMDFDEGVVGLNDNGMWVYRGGDFSRHNDPSITGPARMLEHRLVHEVDQLKVSPLEPGSVRLLDAIHAGGIEYQFSGMNELIANPFLRGSGKSALVMGRILELEEGKMFNKYDDSRYWSLDLLCLPKNLVQNEALASANTALHDYARPRHLAATALHSIWNDPYYTDWTRLWFENEPEHLLKASVDLMKESVHSDFSALMAKPDYSEGRIRGCFFNVGNKLKSGQYASFARNNPVVARLYGQMLLQVGEQEKQFEANVKLRARRREIIKERLENYKVPVGDRVIPHPIMWVFKSVNDGREYGLYESHDQVVEDLRGLVHSMPDSFRRGYGISLVKAARALAITGGVPSKQVGNMSTEELISGFEDPIFRQAARLFGETVETVRGQVDRELSLSN
ncbi:MAG: hypothetical protein AABZ57_06565 [Candidatus Margulisiibacteriota bacterium]